MLVKLNQENFMEETKNGLKLVEFYTNWCSYCKKQEPELSAMDKVWIGKVDAEQSPIIANKHNVNAFPTFIIFKDRKEVRRFSGYRTKEELMNIILTHLD